MPTGAWDVVRMHEYVIEKRQFESRGGHGCSNSDYDLLRTMCCGSYAVEDNELQDLYIDPADLTRWITLLYDPRAEAPPRCPFCGAVTWDTNEVTNLAEVPEAWRWATRRA
jgi:hypothetical protein